MKPYNYEDEVPQRLSTPPNLEDRIPWYRLGYAVELDPSGKSVRAWPI